MYYGPLTDEHQYPGFEKAIKKIADELQSIPGKLYIDDISEEISYSEPRPDACDKCKGSGKDTDYVCADCGGTGFGFLPQYYVIERNEILEAFVGKELIHYIE